MKPDILVFEIAKPFIHAKQESPVMQVLDITSLVIHGHG